MDNNTCIIYCKCGAGVYSDKESETLENTLNEFQLDVYELHDLCAISLSDKEILNLIETKYDHKIIIACYPRAIKNLLKQNGIDFTNYTVLKIKRETAKQVIEKLDSQFELPKGVANYKTKESELEVPAWYPIIDESRCNLCGKCFRFCMFGVYQFDKKSLKVVKPLSCKNNCPACGRNCPTSAIIFPRLKENSVLAGDEPNDETIVSKSAGNKSLLENITERNKNRKSIFRGDVIQQAEEERRKAMEEHKKSIGE